MNIFVVLSNELIDLDWNQITVGFNQSFHLEKQPGALKQYYVTNEFGYSYHAICRNDKGVIIAHSSIFPYHYLVDNEVVLFGLSGGTFVLKEYRKKAFLYLDLMEALQSRCSNNGIKVTYGVSNSNSFELAVKLLGSLFVKDLKYYVIPLSITKLLIKKKFIFVDKLYNLFLKSWLTLNHSFYFHRDCIFSPKMIELYLTKKVKECRFGNRYKKYSYQDFEGVYRLVDENGTQAAYILDFRRNGQRTIFALTKLIQHIVQKENIDIILFVGDLNVSQLLMFNVPKKYEPQRLPLTYDLLDKNNEKLSQILQNPDNWDFGLLNFDAR